MPDSKISALTSVVYWDGMPVFMSRAEATGSPDRLSAEEPRRIAEDDHPAPSFSSRHTSGRMDALGLNLQPFDLARPELWDTWARSFRAYLALRDVTSETMRRATLMTTCGLETLDLVQDLIQPKDLEEVTCEELLAALTAYFMPQLSKRTRRWEFHRRAQQAGESAAEYLAALRRLARNCEFHDLNDVLLDQFIWGLRSEKLAGKLMVLSEDTLSKAVEVATTWEKGHLKEQPALRAAASHHIRPEASSESEGEEALLVRRRTRAQPKGSAQASDRRSKKMATCASCGDPHERQSCCFRDALCHFCGKSGHIARVCRAKASQPAPGARRPLPSRTFQTEESDSLRTLPGQTSQPS